MIFYKTPAPIRIEISDHVEMYTRNFFPMIEKLSEHGEYEASRSFMDFYNLWSRNLNSPMPSLDKEVLSALIGELKNVTHDLINRFGRLGRVDSNDSVIVTIPLGLSSIVLSKAKNIPFLTDGLFFFKILNQSFCRYKPLGMEEYSGFKDTPHDESFTESKRSFFKSYEKFETSRYTSDLTQDNTVSLKAGELKLLIQLLQSYVIQSANYASALNKWLFFDNATSAMIEKNQKDDNRSESEEVGKIPVKWYLENKGNRALLHVFRDEVATIFLIYQLCVQCVLSIELLSEQD